MHSFVQADFRQPSVHPRRKKLSLLTNLLSFSTDFDRIASVHCSLLLSFSYVLNIYLFIYKYHVSGTHHFNFALKWRHALLPPGWMMATMAWSHFVQHLIKNMLKSNFITCSYSCSNIPVGITSHKQYFLL